MLKNESKPQNDNNSLSESVGQVVEAKNEESEVKAPLSSQGKAITELNKESIVSQKNPSGQQTTEINQGKFSNPPEKTGKPRTANKAFGDILDFLLFFENRNPEIKEFAERFQEIESMEEELAIENLKEVIVPQITECLKEEFKKSDEYKKPEEKRKYEYAELFPKGFKTWKEFYKEVFRAYTVNGFLYLHMNEYLRNEDWMQLDALLPYTYSLLKAFRWGSTGQTVQENFETLKRKSKGNILELYRGADFDDDSLNFYDPKNIKNFSWNGVISTSLVESVTTKFQGDSSKRPILIIIEIDFNDLKADNLNALYLAGFSAYPKEEEVALPPGSIFELLEINKENPEVVMRLKLVTYAKILAHKGQLMHGMLQALMRNDDGLKIVCLKEKELSRAIKHCQGNLLIKEIEFCFCTFNERAVGVFREAVPKIGNLASLTLNIVKFEENYQFDEMLKCLEKTQIKRFQIFATLNEKRHIEAMIKSLEYLSSLEYLKLRLEEDCQMNSSLLRDLFRASFQYLDSKCILDIDIGKCYNITTKGSNQNDFEKFGFLQALSTNWPAGWGHPPQEKSENQVDDFQVEREKAEIDIESSNAFNSSKTKDQRCGKIEIIQSEKGMRKYHFKDFQGKNLLEVLERKFIFDSIEEENKKLFTHDGHQSALQEKKVTQRPELLSLHLVFAEREEDREEESQLLRFKQFQDSSLFEYISNQELKALGCQGLRYLPKLTSLHLYFAISFQITDEGLKSLCSKGIQHLLLLNSLDLDFSCCKNLTDEGLIILASEGIQYLPRLTSLSLNFRRCNKITDEGLKSLCSKGIQHLLLITFLHLNFTSCDKITDEGLKSLCSKGIQYLLLITFLHLNFTNCNKITDEGLKSFISGGIANLPKLSSLDLNFYSCEGVTLEGLMSLFSKEIQSLSFRPGSLENKYSQDKTFARSQYFEMRQRLPKLTSLKLGNHTYNHESLDLARILSDNACLPKLSIPESNTAIIGYSIGPGYFFKESPEKSESSILKLLAHYSPFDLQDRGHSSSKQAALKNHHVLFSISSLSRCMTDEISDQLDAFANWQDTETLSLILKFCMIGQTEIFDGLYKNIIQHFKLIRKLHLKSNGACHFSDKVVQSLLYKGIKSLNSLESINFIFPSFEIGERVKRFIYRDSSFLSLAFLTKRKMNFEKKHLQLDSQNLQPCKLQEKLQISKVHNQKIQKVFQKSSQQWNSLTFEEIFNMDPDDMIYQADFCQKQNLQQRIWKIEPELNLDERNLTENYIQEIQSSKERTESLTSIEFDFSENQDIPFLESRSQEFFGLKSLLELNLNLSRRHDLTNERLKTLSIKISDLESLRVLSLNFSGCTWITDEGLSNLSSQGLKHLRNLIELYLDFGFCSKITDNGLNCLGYEGIKHLESLTKLILGFEWCVGLENLSCKWIGSLKQLTELHLNFKSCTGIEDIGAEWISCGLQNLTFLTILSIDFGFDKVHNLDMRSLSQGIHSLESLTELHLNFSHCIKITDQGLEWLSNGLQSLKSLTTLSLNFDNCNRISDQSIKSLSCGGIRYLVSLTHLHLSFDGVSSRILTDNALESLCGEGIQYLVNLKTLEFVYQNQIQITDRGIKTLAFNAMSRLASLEILQLPLMQTATASSSIVEVFRKILIYFGMHKVENP